MGFGGLPFNASSPGPLGNTIPSTVASTALSANAANAGANLITTGLPGSESGNVAVFAGVVPTSNNYSILFIPGSGEMDLAATSQIFMRVGGVTVMEVFSNQVALTNGIVFSLGNAAVTGLVAGALAALTNATLTIKDVNGQAYRIPCII